jgi:hypothetical protein
MESTPFAEALLPTQRDAIAPDGSQVRLLVRLPGGSMAHFELGPGEVSRATQHRTVSEAWYILQGAGPDVAPPGRDRTSGRPAAGYRAHDPGGHGVPVPQHGFEPLAAVGVTMPPWPGEDEAMDVAVLGRRSSRCSNAAKQQLRSHARNSGRTRQIAREVLASRFVPT